MCCHISNGVLNTAINPTLTADETLTRSVLELALLTTSLVNITQTTAHIHTCSLSLTHTHTNTHTYICIWFGSRGMVTACWLKMTEFGFNGDSCKNQNTGRLLPKTSLTRPHVKTDKHTLVMNLMTQEENWLGTREKATKPGLP